MESHHAITFASIFFVIMLLWASQEDLNIRMAQPTGQHVVSPPDFNRPATYAYTLNHHMQDFFNVPNAVFPECACTQVAREIGRRFDEMPLQVTEDFTTYGPQRVSSRVFGIEQEFAGGLEMVYGKDLVNKPGQDSAINMLVETVVRLPRLERSSGVEMTLYGVTEDVLYVNAGRIRTPMLECTFYRTVNNQCNCMCETGLDYDYVNE